ncbi:major facilitator superfamily domain-containing protein [Scenedesmus sp. NREL 46B-D3]|nr:major facilitator superfamily domain-containing protein [Scenedesmus sp. NREL 46B-D3]
MGNSSAAPDLPTAPSVVSSAFGSSSTADKAAEPIDVQATEVPPRTSIPILTLPIPAAAAAAPAAAPAPGDRGWVKVVGVCAFAAMLCYLDRTNISTAIVPMAEQFGWNKQFCGAVLSAFFAGYGATQVLGGQWSDKYGGSAVLAGGLVLWSVATALTPFAAAWGTMPLLAARTLLGMGQGVAFPAMHALLVKHVPHKVRSGAIGIIMACAHCGTALGFGASPAIIDGMGWGWTYYLFGGAALLWLPFWLNMGKEKAKAAAKAAMAAATQQAHQLQQRAAAASAHVMQSGGSTWYQAGSLATAGGAAALCSSAAAQDAVMPAARHAPGGTSRSAHPLLDSIQQHDQQQQQQALLQQRAAAAAARSSSNKVSSSSNPNVGFWPLMRRKEVWAIAVAQYMSGWGFYGLLAWLPSFFIEHCGLQLSQLGGFTLAPYLLQAVVGASAGILADNLIVQRNWGIRDVRVLMQVAGMLGPAACLFAAASPLSAHSPYLATGLITVAMGMSALTCSGVSASHLDIAPRHAGVVFGVGNTAGTLAGLVAEEGIVNELLKHGGNTVADMLLQYCSLMWQLEQVHQVPGTVVSMPKKGDLTDPGNYRGITLLSVLYKFYTSVLNQRLIKFAEGEQQEQQQQTQAQQQQQQQQQGQHSAQQQQQQQPRATAATAAAAPLLHERRAACGVS